MPEHLGTSDKDLRKETRSHLHLLVHHDGSCHAYDARAGTKCRAPNSGELDPSRTYSQCTSAGACERQHPVLVRSLHELQLSAVHLRFLSRTYRFLLEQPPLRLRRRHIPTFSMHARSPLLKCLHVHCINQRLFFFLKLPDQTFRCSGKGRN